MLSNAIREQVTAAHCSPAINTLQRFIAIIILNSFSISINSAAANSRASESRAVHHRERRIPIDTSDERFVNCPRYVSHGRVRQMPNGRQRSMKRRCKRVRVCVSERARDKARFLLRKVSQNTKSNRTRRYLCYAYK